MGGIPGQLGEPEHRVSSQDPNLSTRDLAKGLNYLIWRAADVK